ncbi:hypothetical protein, partial [Burkholderia territorii]|uniref:hypothetical protein n=1 Tax=Burkholderia territorii TaxID=1503055 RepID=UPI000B2179AB
QKLHDSMSPTDWPRELWNLACHRGLSTDVVDDMMGVARADRGDASEAAFRAWLDAIVRTHAPRIEVEHDHVFV